MKFTKIEIQNFRNFEDVSVDLDNKNIFFGMNDIGKTNLLQAIKFLFDKNTRKFGLLETDYHQLDTSKMITITVTIALQIDQSTDLDEDSKKILAVFGQYLKSEDRNIKFKLKSEYDQNENESQISLYCSGDSSDFAHIDINSIYTSAIDRVFNVVYIDSYIDIKRLFNKNMKSLLNSSDNLEDELSKIQEIKQDVSEINKKIQNLQKVKEFSQKITTEFMSFNNNKEEVSLKSELLLNNIYSNLVPYLKESDNDGLYPTSGEGRKKLLGYSLYKAISDIQKEQKINIFLLEEPETNLHRALQLSLSSILYNNVPFKYLFLTTHSPLMLSEMDNVNLVRIFRNGKKINSKSCLYKVNSIFNEKRKYLNKTLAESIFSKIIFLVEGPSEYELFTHVLSLIKPNFELDGIYILPVNGVAFNGYKQVYSALNIPFIIKTDNDLKKAKTEGNSDEYIALGFSRINSLIEKDTLTEKFAIPAPSYSLVEEKRKLYEQNKDKLEKIQKENHIFLSRCSLEEDLEETGILKALLVDKKTPVKYLKESKLYHMVELISNRKFDKNIANTIYNHPNFICLRDLLNYGNN